MLGHKILWDSWVGQLRNNAVTGSSGVAAMDRTVPIKRPRRGATPNHLPSAAENPARVSRIGRKADRTALTTADASPARR